MPEATVSSLLSAIAAHASLLRADAVHSDESGSTSRETAALLERIGCFRITGLVEAGGLGEGTGAVVRVAHRLAQQHPSAAWNVVVSNSHLASAQSFAGNPFVPGNAGLRPSLCGSYGSRDAHAEPVRGGCAVSGSWGPASNAEHATWATVDAAHAEHGRAIMILPLEDMAVRRTWRAIGLRGTASHTLVAEGVFVPADRIMPAQEFFADGPPGSPLAMRQPKVLRTGLGLAAVVLGAARAFHTLLIGRGGFSATTFREDPSGVSPHAVYAHELGAGGTRLEAAEHLLLATADAMDDVVRVGGTVAPSAVRAARARLSRIVRDASDALHELSFLGGSALAVEGTEIGRLWRDARAGLTHGAFAPAPGFALAGANALHPASS